MKAHENRKEVLSDTSRRQVEHILGEGAAERLRDIDDCDAGDLDALREALGEEQFQALMDELAEGGAHER